MDHYYKVYLTDEFERRKLKNTRYSMRSFAKAINLDAGLLSKVLAGKHTPSLESAEKIVKALLLTPKEAEAFIASIADERKNRQLKHHGLNEQPKRQVQHLENDIFETISKLYHNAILELICVDDAPSTARAIAKRLGITNIEAEHAIARLHRLGLISQTSSGYQKTDSHVDTSDRSKTSPALKEQQREIFKAALAALDKQPIESRSHTGITMAIDPDKLPMAKKMIDEFMFNLCEMLESGKRKEVYQLGVGLFSLEPRSRG